MTTADALDAGILLWLVATWIYEGHYMARGRKKSPGGLADKGMGSIIPPSGGSGTVPARATDTAAANLDPPDGMSLAAVVKWRQLVPLIARACALVEADADALAQYCEAVAMRAKALAALDEPGAELVLVTPNGAHQINPLLTIANQQQSVMMKLSERFGLDPASRKRLQIEAAKGESAFLEFLNRKPGK